MLLISRWLAHASLLGLTGSLSCSAPAFAESSFLAPQDIPAFVSKAPGADRSVRLCSFHAYSKDADVNGSNLRAGPDLNAAVLAVIPGERAEAGTKIGPEFEVLGSKDEWLLIRGVHWAGYDKAEKMLFSGPGWISAGLVSFEAEDPWVRDAPRAEARKVVELQGRDLIIKRVHGCSGSFVDVDYELDGEQKGRGWVSGACANQVTTCSGGSPYIEERNGKLVMTGSPSNQ